MELMEEHLYGPDFPTGGYILGRAGIKSAYETVAVRSLCEPKLTLKILAEENIN